MAASDKLAAKFIELTRENPHQVASADVDEASDALIRRADSGGMVVVDQDIYLRNPIGKTIADLVLSAATWGEETFSRCNGERRLRLYSKFYDPPGEAMPDWKIIAGFARRIGFEGYDWQDSNDVFEEAAMFSRNGMLNCDPLTVKARQEGKDGHEKLREFGTTGIQTPIRVADGELVGTQRLHDSSLKLGPPEGVTVHPKWLTHFHSHSGKAILVKSPWEWFSDFYDRVTPRGDELWITNGRINEIWQSAFDDVRKPYINSHWPEQFVEIHPDDAERYGVESGGEIRIFSDDILVQTGGFHFTRGNDFLFANLDKNGYIRAGSGEMTAVAIVTDAVRRGVVFANFLHPRWPGAAANSLVHRVPDPITNRYRFKLGKGIVERTGESPFKHSFDKMTFKPRTIM